MPLRPHAAHKKSDVALVEECMRRASLSADIGTTPRLSAARRELVTALEEAGFTGISVLRATRALEALSVRAAGAESRALALQQTNALRDSFIHDRQVTFDVITCGALSRRWLRVGDMRVQFRPRDGAILKTDFGGSPYVAYLAQRRLTIIAFVLLFMVVVFIVVVLADVSICERTCSGLGWLQNVCRSSCLLSRKSFVVVAVVHCARRRRRRVFVDDAVGGVGSRWYAPLRRAHTRTHPPLPSPSSYLAADWMYKMLPPTLEMIGELAIGVAIVVRRTLCAHVHALRSLRYTRTRPRAPPQVILLITYLKSQRKSRSLGGVLESGRGSLPTLLPVLLEPTVPRFMVSYSWVGPLTKTARTLARVLPDCWLDTRQVRQPCRLNYTRCSTACAPRTVQPRTACLQRRQPTHCQPCPATPAAARVSRGYPARHDVCRDSLFVPSTDALTVVSHFAKLLR